LDTARERFREPSQAAVRWLISVEPLVYPASAEAETPPGIGCCGITKMVTKSAFYFKANAQDLTVRPNNVTRRFVGQNHNAVEASCKPSGHQRFFRHSNRSPPKPDWEANEYVRVLDIYDNDPI
jgi:hypothetical protein